MLVELERFLHDDQGATLTEYGLLAAALALPMMAAFTAIASAGGNTLQTTGTGLTSLGTNP